MMDTLGTFLFVFVFALVTIAICSSVAPSDGIHVRSVKTVVVHTDDELDQIYNGADR
ncbi:hypothetical protein [Hyphomicrobium methylovorum]|uniref:hypothetical protein n=1 Tax=Hyphomicrobium methylovorum TaxID=84 RepID=UPI0015E7D508|nr:hypothetical protein [Hyphomicrobium methylovorum]